jgi:phosphate uptake regulator
METRKIQQVGGGTFTVSIPVDWAKERGLEAGKTVYLYSHRDGSLLIRAGEKGDSNLANFEYEVGELPPTPAARLALAAYQSGYQRIVLRWSSSAKSPDHRQAIADVIRELPGVEIGKETDQELTIQGLLNASDVSIRQSILHLRYTVLSMHEAAVDAAVGRSQEIDFIEQRADEIGRLAMLVTRHFNRGLSELDEIDQLDISRPDLYAYHQAAVALDRIATEAVNISDSIDPAASDIDPEFVSEVVHLGEAARTVVDDALDALLANQPPVSALKILEDGQSLVAETEDFGSNLLETSNKCWYQHVSTVDGLRRTAEAGTQIADIALQRQIRQTGDQSVSKRV